MTDTSTFSEAADMREADAERDALAHDLVIERARKTIVEQERDALMAAAKLALIALYLACRNSDRIIDKEYEQAIEALKKAGVKP